MPGLAADLDLFLELHGDHAPFDVTATEHTAHGDWLRVRCPCGVLFERYVTAADAEADLVAGTLEALEAEARKAKRRLWSEPSPMPPWEWRRRNRERGAGEVTPPRPSLLSTG